MSDVPSSVWMSNFLPTSNTFFSSVYTRMSTSMPKRVMVNFRTRIV